MQPSRDETSQHITCRIGIIAQMLLNAGASTGNALSSAVNAKCAELIHAIRGKESAKSKKLAEIQTMAPMVNVAKALDECIDTDINLTSHIPELDEITMDHMVARGVDFTKGIMKNDVYSGPPIARLAYYGLTEFMKKILSSAKLFDDPKFTSSITESSDCKFYAWRGIRPLLQMACQRSIWNMDMVKLLVEEGQVDLNAHQMLREVENGTMTDKIQGTTALHILAEGNFWWQIEAVTYLGEHGAEVDILDENGRTPLEIASTYSEHSSKIGRKFFRPQCCEALLKLGANPNKINPEGLTALNKAGSDRDTVQLLLKYGADINAGMKGLLASAIESGDVKILQLCLENGADPNVPDHSTDSSFRAQHEKGNVAREYPIVTAALQNRYKKYSVSTAVEMIELLLDHGARVDLPIDQEQTILHHLFANATSATLQPFFERSGIDMNSRDQSGRTVLLSAISNPTATELEEHTVRPGRHQPQSRYVNPCIHLINSKTHGSSLDFLAVDNEGRHIIFYLIYRWTTEVSSLLLSIPGVRSLITQKDNAGYSPLHHAFAAPRFTPHFPITKIVDTFLNEGGTDLLEPDPQSDTALHYISRKLPSEPPGLLPFMDRFIALGCDMNARNDMGMTPLLEYLQCSRYQSNLPWFKEHGADFKVKNNEGEGALHIVAKKKAYISAWRKVNEERNPVAQLFEVLVKEYGCEVLDEDEKGRTALDIAAAVGNQKILELFQRKR